MEKNSAIATIFSGGGALRWENFEDLFYFLCSSANFFNQSEQIRYLQRIGEQHSY